MPTTIDNVVTTSDVASMDSVYQQYAALQLTVQQLEMKLFHSGLVSKLTSVECQTDDVIGCVRKDSCQSDDVIGVVRSDLRESDDVILEVKKDLSQMEPYERTRSHLDVDLTFEMEKEETDM